MVHQEVTPVCWISGPAVFRIVLTLCSLMLSGCVATEHGKIASQNATVATRKQGEQMVHTPEKTRAQYACASHRKTMLQLEEVQVLPEVVIPGKEVNQRIRYALCPSTPVGTLKGRITRTVLFKGKAMFRDAINYEFKPGTWTVDAFIGIPQEAKSGVYTLNLAVRYGHQTLQESSVFTVKSQ